VRKKKKRPQQGECQKKGHSRVSGIVKRIRAEQGVRKKKFLRAQQGKSRVIAQQSRLVK